MDLTAQCRASTMSIREWRLSSNFLDSLTLKTSSYPATAMLYGIQDLSETYFGTSPDLAVSGPNVGGNRTPIQESSEPTSNNRHSKSRRRSLVLWHCWSSNRSIKSRHPRNCLFGRYRRPNRLERLTSSLLQHRLRRAQRLYHERAPRLRCTLLAGGHLAQCQLSG